MVRVFLFLLFLGILIPSQTDVKDIDFPKISSNISMPIRIPMAEIAQTTNSAVKDLIFEDNSFTDNNNDQFKIKVWKTNPIRFVGGIDQNILIEVPLKIWAQKGIGTLGVYSYQETTFETTMYFNTTIVLNTNWIMTTKTKPNGFKWVSKPVLDFGSIKIPITTVVEKSLKEEQQKFSDKIDLQMKDQLNFQSSVLLAWNLFSEPFHISEEYNTWLKITPSKVSMTPLKIYHNAIDFTANIDVFSETFTGRKPSLSKPISKVPNFTFVPELKNDFLLQTTANIPFTEATAIAKKMFLSKEFDFRESKSKIKVMDIKVDGENDKVRIEIDTDGAIKGKSVITGVPYYDSQKRKIVLKNTEFKLNTSNLLYKTALVFFKGKIVKMIEDEYGIPTQEIEDFSRKSTEETFNKEYYKGLQLMGKVNQMQPSKVIVGPNGLTAVIDMKAQLKLLVEGL